MTKVVSKSFKNKLNEFIKYELKSQKHEKIVKLYLIFLLKVI